MFVCVWLCWVVRGCLDSSCFGSFNCFRLFWVDFHSIQFFEVDLYCVSVFPRKFGCLRLVHDVSHCFSCFLSIQIIGQVRFFMLFCLSYFFSCWIVSLTYVHFMFVVSWYFGSFKLF